MAVTRPVKEGSVTTYQAKVAAGFPDILASEMDADLDTIYAAWNGGVTTANIGDGSITTAKLAPNLQTWQTGAGNPITPIDATKVVTIPVASSDALVLGSGTAKGHFGLTPTTSVAMRFNANIAGNASDDATKASWSAQLDAGDTFSLWRAPAAAGSPAFAQVFSVKGSDAKTYCTLADGSVAQVMLAPGITARAPVSANFPTGYAWNTASAWANVVSVSITTHGGWVLVSTTPALSMTPLTSLTRIFIVVSRGAAWPSGTAVAVCSIPLQAPAGTMLPLPTLCAWDHPAAGAQVYYYSVNVSGGTVTSAADTPGQLTVTELT